MFHAIRVSLTLAGALAAAAALAQAPAMTSPIPKDEQGLLERLHQANQWQQRLAKLAANKAVAPAVKQLAQSLLNDHQKADQAVMSQAQERRWKLADPTPVDELERKMIDAHKAVLSKLEAMSGEMFDRAYLSRVVELHDELLAQLAASQQQAFARGAEVGRLISQELPVLAQHRDSAYRLLGQLRPGGPGVGGAGMMPEHKMPMQPMHPMPMQPPSGTQPPPSKGH